MKHKPDQALGHREVFCFFLAELLLAASAADAGARAIGADADVGFAWWGGGDGAGAGRAQPATGSSATIANSAAPTVVALSPRSLSAAAAADRKDQRNLAALTELSLPSRARARRRRFQRALTPTDLHRPARRRCGCWPTSTVLLLAELLLADSAADAGARAIGADADVGFAWSGPAAMVPAPIERSQLPGHRQQIGNSAAPTVGRSPSLAQRCGRCGSERSAEFGRVNHFRCPHARARGGADSSAL